MRQKQNQRRRSMFRSNVSIEVGLLREFGLANGTTEFGLDAALVVPMSPKRRAQLVATTAIRASMLFLSSSFLLGLSHNGRQQVTLEASVTFQRGH